LTKKKFQTKGSISNTRAIPLSVPHSRHPAQRGVDLHQHPGKHHLPSINTTWWNLIKTYWCKRQEKDSKT